MLRSSVSIGYCVHDDCYHLAESIRSFQTAGSVVVFVSRSPWNDLPGDWETAARVAEQAGAEVVLGDWTSEREHRQACFEGLLERGCTHALTPDGDEFVEPALLEILLTIAHNELADCVYVWMDTYWQSPEYLIRPREQLTPVILVDLRRVQVVRDRYVVGGRSLVLPPEYGVLHHLSYAGPDERIRRKLTTFSHKDEVRPGWWEKVWLRWKSDKLLRNLHPTHPAAYEFVERIEVPELLRPAFVRYCELTGNAGGGGGGDGISPLNPLPTVSVIIPIHGGAEDLGQCLQSLTTCQDLLLEVLVIDNASPDNSAEVAASGSFVQLIRNQENRGFPAACNQGTEQTRGEVLIFLNSDTVVPRAGLIRLLETLMQSDSIGAAGPSYTNYSGHHQQIAPTYTSLKTLDLFAEDFARQKVDDVETDMLVGFCLAVKRSVLQEVGPFDERFGTGMFEDNDLCYRIRRAGYRLMIAARSFVHHHGSRTFARARIDPRPLLERNHALFVEKWREDLEAGFASHLPGLSAERIIFDPAKHPDMRCKRMRTLAQQANISLCMIVRNEERVIADALRSAEPFFTEMIVVDTGSEDRTREIAYELGAAVYEFPWTDSFAEARNESLKHAAGQWIFWMDADDVLPWSAGEAIVYAALHAPPHVTGYVVPVQFLEQGQWSTRVDHVKLFRNFPGVHFEGRIHEQVLPSLRARGGLIERLEAVVLHANYDTSAEGQTRKRERDFKLLELDLAERPDHPFVLFNLGMTCHYTDQHEQAVEWLRRCLQVSTPHETFLRKVYSLLAVSLRALGQPEECLETLDQGLALFPDDPELNFQKGYALEAMQRYTEAKLCFKQALSADTSGYYSSVDVGLMGFKSYYHLGVICHAEGNYLEAKEWWLKSIAEAPQLPTGSLSLFGAALQVGDFATARQMLEHLHRLEGVSEPWVQWGMEYAFRVGGAANVELFLQGLMQQHPHSLVPRLMLARYLLQSECRQEAYPHLLHLNDRGVAEAAFYLGVYSVQLGDFRQALNWMERALTLNPDHEQTREQVERLKQLQGVEGREREVRS